ncbi:MAG TPA: EAL domain-containing protein, partial [Chloroflexota bacterium]|nr:EAL domain-containing protein [Chloroflexota bacterium]
PTRLSLGSALRRAIHEQQLQLYYQPKVHYRTGTITSVEALVRWRHPELGLLEPDQFVALAEHTGLIVPLTQWVLNTALQQCREWQAAGLALGVAVNLSMRNLQDPGLLATITAALAATRLPPRYLTLELTETAFMADPDRALTVLTQLSEMGVSIAIDDFGTGYSSLGYLKRLPVHQIKIDKSFVLNMAAEKNDFTIVRSTIDLGHNLGLCVVAEGVEDHHTWNLLACLGCDGAQGYYISRPLPVTQLLHRLIESPWPPRTIDRADAPVPDAAWGAN